MRCQQWIRNDANRSLKNNSRMLLKGSNNCVSHMASKPNAQWFENDFQNLKSLGDYKNTKLETQTKPQPATTKSKIELHPPPTTRTRLLAIVRLRSNPCNSATEVANSMVLSVALGAQGSALATRPCLFWDAVLSQAIITKATCDQAAIDARPAAKLLVAVREDLHRDISRSSTGSSCLWCRPIFRTTPLVRALCSWSR